MTFTVGLSAIIGVLLGLMGGGGSILMVPLLVFVAGLGGHEAIKASLLVVGTSSIAALLPHALAGQVRWRVGRPSRPREWLGPTSADGLPTSFPRPS